MQNNYYSPQAYESISTVSTGDAGSVAAALALLAVLWIIIVIFSLIGYIISSLALMQIFKKAGAPRWAAWVPFYNTWKILEIGGQQGFWAILAVVPIVNIVSIIFLYIAMFHIGKKLGKSGGFVVLGIFLPLVWTIWLAVDKSTWDDSASDAPSLHDAVAPEDQPDVIATQAQEDTQTPPQL